MDKNDNVAKTDDIEKKPTCISSKTWERFEALKKRTDDVTKRSTEKRIKYLQKNILQNVEVHMSSDEEKAILKKHNVHVNPAVNVHLASKKDTAASASTEILATTSCHTENQTGEQNELFGTSGYSELGHYLGINDHLKQGVGIDGGPKSGLENQIEAAVQKGDVKTAEQLSDRLATRDYGVKIADAVAARDYTKRKKEEEETLQAKKKKKLNWGFEHKQRWETKSNM